ncbi:MAG: hypothetical protein ACRD0P_00835 [Stackebrandtia sp.]
MHATPTRPIRDEAELRGLLSQVLDLVPDTRYRLVGTGAAMLHGVRLPVGDIDLLYAARADIDRFAAALGTFPCQREPIWLPAAHQYYAAYAVGDISVSASTLEAATREHAIERRRTAPWQHYRLIGCRHHRIPAVALELQLVADVLRERPDRYRPVIEHLRRHGHNRALLERSLRDWRLPESRHRWVLDRLDGAAP